MNIPIYPVTRVDNEFIFYFKSLDPLGKNPVFKLVSYVIYYKHGAIYYNLGFGDYDVERNTVSDTAVSNNGDMRKILATVVSTLEVFFKEKPHEIVHIEGSDPVRMAYYHKLIADYAQLIEEEYVVKGRYLGKIELFQKGKNYEFILIKKREVISLLEEPIIVMTTPKKIRSEQEQEQKLIQFLSNKKAEDLFPEKNKRAWENLKRAGLIKD